MDNESLLKQLHQELQAVTTLQNLESIEIKYLGRNGLVNERMAQIKEIPAAERKTFGAQMNELKNQIAKDLESQKAKLLSHLEEKSTIDITMPGKPYPHGSLHMVTLAIEEITKIFERIGFSRMSYPEVEWEHFAFEALNMPKEHPARDDFETFFVDELPHAKFGKMILSPHTSSGQVREMLSRGTPPIRMINIAKTYRPNWDASHVPMFHQFEGLCVDRGINITHLKGTINYFVKEFFGENREIRLRPFHFQFTEPSFEIDVSCGVCLGTGLVDGKKCKICKSGWLELAGSGMVHPNVLRAGGIDPEEYSGWAFGFGVERPMMMKEGLKLDDMRTMYNGDIRFLEQF
jgi:phenylalanyl-tRNA synthetase alpha chain